MVPTEFEALQLIDNAVSSLAEDERTRVLQWVLSKYGSALGQSGNTKLNFPGGGTPMGQGAGINPEGNEIPGIARLSPEGAFQLTVRDLKAKNTNDAAIRIVHIICLANEVLTNNLEVSSKSVIVPILKQWRAYTGNTRNAISKHRGILRNGDNVSLDAHAKKDAESYMKEIIDDSMQGKWKPSSGSKKRA